MVKGLRILSNEEEEQVVLRLLILETEVKSIDECIDEFEDCEKKHLKYHISYNRTEMGDFHEQLRLLFNEIKDMTDKDLPIALFKLRDDDFDTDDYFEVMSRRVSDIDYWAIRYFLKSEDISKRSHDKVYDCFYDIYNSWRKLCHELRLEPKYTAESGYDRRKDREKRYKENGKKFI